MSDPLPSGDTDRNLLFAVLALQADLLDREHFVQACTLWAVRKDVPIADLLVEQGWLTAEDRADVDRLLGRKLNKHGGDVQASLAEAAGAEARDALTTVADAEVRSSVAVLTGPYLPAPQRERDRDGRGPDSAGRNILFEEIGRGGIGRVLRGRDPGLRRDLAVKVLRDEYRDDAAVQRRFVEEAQVGGQLQHPGVVPVYELGHFSDRCPYFTMKLVRGRTLADLLKERPDPGHDLPRFLTIFKQVCQTVAYAHSKGVIHRDLKPQNVMVGAFGEVQVMDWGLAKVLGRRDGDPEATAAGTVIRTARTDSTAEPNGRTGVVGTPAYMAPEQARGDAEAVDERADVFGLGAILCVLLTGQPPFAGTGREGVLRQAAAGDLAEALARLEGCRADRELVALCRDCLAPERDGRPAGAGAVAARMAAYQAAVQERLRQAELDRAAAQARAEEAKATATAERKARRRTRALAAALLALVAAGAGGGLLLQRQARRDAEQRQAVAVALQKAAGLREQARWREAQAVLEQARQGLGDPGLDDLRRRVDTAEAELALVNRLDTIRQQRATFVEGQFDFRKAKSDYAAAFRRAGLGEVGDDEATVAARVRATGIAGPLVAALDDWASLPAEPTSKSWLLKVARRAAPDLWGDRFRDLAVWLDRQALQSLADEALRDGGARLDDLSPQVLHTLGSLLRGSAEAMQLLRAAQRRHPDDFWLNLELGYALLNAKQAEEAVGYFRVAVALRPDAGAARNNLGLALRATKDVEGAVAEYRKAIDLDPKHATAHNNLGVALCDDKKDLEGAITEYRLAIDSDPKLANAHYNLGNALRTKGDLDRAIAEYRLAIDCDPKYAGPHNNLGIALYDKGDVDGAIAEYRLAIGSDPKLANAHNNLGNALRAKKDVDGAIAEYRKAIDLDPKYAAAHSNLGTALYTKQDMDGAIAEFRKAIAINPTDAMAHNNLGCALGDKNDMDGAIAEFRKATGLDPRLALAHAGLGRALLARGRFAEARVALRRGLELLPQRTPLHQDASQSLQECEGMIAVDEKLSAILSGEADPADAAECLALAQLCQRYKRLHASAARFYAGAFAADPRLAADLRQQPRYYAARSAALAAAAQGEGARRLPDKARLMLGRQALAWLRDHLAAYAKLAEGMEPTARQAVRENLRHWQQDTDLAPVRDPQTLDQLPDDERLPWRQLWDDVAALLRRVEPQK